MAAMLRKLGVAAVAVLVVGAVCARPAVAFPAFRDSIPNGMRGAENVAALGHRDPNGGGNLNKFGKDFRDAGMQWTVSLCRMDSDGDGESNGLELGDPCCVWQADSGRPPSRAWKVRHPGNANSVTGLDVDEVNKKCAIEMGAAHNDTHFWKFYYDTNGANANWEAQGLVKDVTTWFDETRTNFDHNGMKVVFGFLYEDDGGPAMRSTKNFMTMLALGMLASLVWFGVLGDFWRSSAKENLLMVVVAIAWTDLASGLLHIVLDNPLMNPWPVIGKEAEAFQGHHFDPNAVARGHILDFVREHHILVALTGIVNLPFHPSCKRLRMFLFHFWWSSHLMMLAHRWSHTHPAHLAPLVSFMQTVGIIMTPTHHSLHHVSFDNNFAIFGGWVNPVLNQAVKLHSWRSPLWFFLFLGWGLTPVVVSFSAIGTPLVRYAVKVRDQVLRATAAVLRVVCRAASLADTLESLSESGVALSAKGAAPSAAAPVGGAAASAAASAAATITKSAKAARGIAGGQAAADIHGPTALYLSIWGVDCSNRLARRVYAAACFVLLCGTLWWIVSATLESQALNARSNLTAHIALMSLGVALAAAGALVHRLSPAGGRALLKARGIHRLLQMGATACFVTGFGFILAHLSSRDRSWLPEHGWVSHSGLGLLSMLTVPAMGFVGYKKHTALQATGTRVFRWHGTAGFWTLMLLIMTVSLGMTAAAGNGVAALMHDTPIMFANAALFSSMLLAAFALQHLPSVEVRLDAPASFLIHDWLLAHPRWFSRLLLALIGAVPLAPLRHYALRVRKEVDMREAGVTQKEAHLVA